MHSAPPLIHQPLGYSMDEESLERLFKRSAREGEEGLMLAVLEDAIACLRKYAHARDKRGRAQFREAEDWILERESDWIFSFANICETLGIDPSYLREGLLKWKENESRLKQEPPRVNAA